MDFEKIYKFYGVQDFKAHEKKLKELGFDSKSIIMAYHSTFITNSQLDHDDILDRSLLGEVLSSKDKGLLQARIYARKRIREAD